MKPADGKTHKACAILCLEGGLPPLVAAEIPGESRLYPLLRVDGSTALPERVLGVVGEPVRMTGQLSEVHGVPTFDVRASDIRRLGSWQRSPPDSDARAPSG